MRVHRGLTFFLSLLIASALAVSARAQQAAPPAAAALVGATVAVGTARALAGSSLEAAVEDCGEQAANRVMSAMAPNRRGPTT